MHSIERYGIVALLFLVVTVIAVLMWDGSKKKKEKEASSTTVSAPTELGGAHRPGLPSEEQSKLTLRAESEPGPLYRDPPGPERAAAAPAGAQPRASLPETKGPEQALEQARTREPDSLELSTARETAAEALTPDERALVASQPNSSVPESTGTRRYSVRPGDTLSEIAQHELGSARRWKEIVSANPGLDPARLQVGREILLPVALLPVARSAAELASSAPADPASARTAPASPAPRWTVGKGESLWKIAQRALGDGERWREIVALNPGLDPGHLGVGTQLRLPASKSTAKSSAAPLVASAAGSARPSRQGGKVK